jgi:tRNA(Ile)-lysidine synthase
MLQAFQNHINSILDFLNRSKVLLAVSGGVDSVVLAHLCKKIDLDIALAHCNFNLRGAESDLDEKFVIDLGNQLNVEVFYQRFDTKSYAKQNKLSTQMAARELRYQWFDELCEQLHFEYILTAHHADDNLETFLINLSRGTGLDGLTGIPEINALKVRPMLQFSRADIEGYAKLNSLEWREDKSNSSKKYLRNKLRHEVIPVLKEINPQLLLNFGKTIDHIQDSKQILEDRIDQVSDEIIDVREDGVYFNVEAIQALNNPKAYLYELLKSYGFTEWDDINNLLNAQSGKQVFSKDWRLIKNRSELILTQRESEIKEVVQHNDSDVIEFKNGKLRLETVTSIGENSPSSIFVDKDKLERPLIVRSFKKGDLFYPSGMRGKKKISKYFKDEKLSLIEKENCSLLCSGNDIVWVINRRADRRFEVSENTTNILKITFTA